MFTSHHYVPILKGKEGEFSAIAVTSEDTLSRMTPIIELMNFAPLKLTPEQLRRRRKPMPTFDSHIKKELQGVVNCWKNGNPIFIDLHLITAEELYSIPGGYVSLIFDELISKGVRAIPTIYSDADSRLFADCIKIHERHGVGIGIRLRPMEMASREVLLRTQTALGLAAKDLDLILDYQSIIGHKVDTLVENAKAFINTILYDVNTWRTLTVASGAFPVDLRDYKPLTQNDLQRNDWLFWEKLSAAPLVRKPAFGDYSIAHPDITVLDRVPDVSASIRYTAEKSWKIMRGQGVNKRGWEQIRERCKELIKLPEYDGRDFSWGDQFIDDCAKGSDGPGAGTAWRKTANNRHFEKTCSAISSLALL